MKYTNKQLTLLVVLRVLIGWHFLYEGIAKWMNPAWSSIGFLMDSKGFLSGFFKLLASDPSVLKVVDVMNIYGLMAIGLGLIMGLFTRVSLVAGMTLLGFYFLSHPPMIGFDYAVPSEGSYLWINKNLIELFMMAVLLVFPTGRIIGIDRLICGSKDDA